MEEQMVEEANIHIVLRDVLSIKLMHFDHLEGAPSQIVSQLMLSAYADNFDYFYQVNDDTSIVTPNWAPKLITMLAANPSIPNFGVTGPADSNNNKIFTHSFVHRTHFEVLVTNALLSLQLLIECLQHIDRLELTSVCLYGAYCISGIRSSVPALLQELVV